MSFSEGRWVWEVLGDHSNVSCLGEGRALWDKLHLSADTPGQAGLQPFWRCNTPSRGKVYFLFVHFSDWGPDYSLNWGCPRNCIVLEEMEVWRGLQRGEEEKKGVGRRIGPEKGRRQRGNPPASFGYDSPRLQMENRTEHPWLRNAIRAKKVESNLHQALKCFAWEYSMM